MFLLIEQLVRPQIVNRNAPIKYKMIKSITVTKQHSNNKVTITMRAVKRLLVNYRPMIFVILDTRP